MANQKLKKEVLQAVNQQIKDNDPPFVRDAFLQLRQQGYSKIRAKESIGAVLLTEMDEMITTSRAYDEKIYKENIQRIVAGEFVPDDTDLEEDDDIQQARYRIYAAIFEHKSEEAVKVFMDIWEDIKRYVKVHFYKVDTGGKVTKPQIIDIDEATDFKYELFNWLADMELEFHNAQLHEERIRFCREVMDLFRWERDAPYNFETAIGEALMYLERYEESNRWFENCLGKEPDNIDILNIYLFCVIQQNDLEKAKNLIEKYLEPFPAFTEESEILLYRVLEVYKKLKNVEKIEYYEKMLDEYGQWYHELMSEYSNMWDEPFYFSQPIVKEKKIYPNDPCPCGSGKKYKKCCRGK